MPMDSTVALWRYALRHVLLLMASTLVLLIYLFFVTLIDGWGSRFGNGLGGGIALLVWLLVPSLTVGRRFGLREGRKMAFMQAVRIALPAAAIIGGIGIWIGAGMRSSDPALRLSEMQFWALHVGYGMFVLAVFCATFMLRSWAASRGLSRGVDHDTPPPS